MKGILLAGGSGTRLYPLTFPTSKQLLPVYDKPMIYYPLSVLMQARIQTILLISTSQDLPRFQHLLGDGSHLGLSISYAEQKEPKGIAQAFTIGESFIGDEPVALILGDNIFYGPHLDKLVYQCRDLESGGIIFGCQVQNPSRYGVVAFDSQQQVIDIIEKPKKPPSSYAVTGLYLYDQSVVDIAKSLKVSWRNEFEITDVNCVYLKRKELRVHLFEKDFVWLDTGTFEDLHRAANYVQSVQAQEGIKIGCIEEIAYQNGWITQEELFLLAMKQRKSGYGTYLEQICNSEKV